ncbi:MAG: FtsW/RodA/SpoVE family cell cycle protein [Candidatus Woesearchaeota archaeon]
MYSLNKKKEFDFFKQLDFFILIPTILLTLIGLVVVRSAVLTRPDGGISIMITQTAGLVIGISLCFVLTKIDYKDLKTLAYVLYAFSLFLVVIVIFYGYGEELGSRRWLSIAGVSFQPTEITKITFIIIVSVYLEKLIEKPKDILKNIFYLALFSILPIALIIIQKDFGTSLIFIAILLTMLFIYGLKYKYFFILFGTLIMTSPLAWFFLLNETRKNRIRVFLDPSLDPLGAGMNVIRSKMSIGSGQLFGQGLFNGPQTQSSQVPVKESDFIFSVIGEELGFLGGLVILAIILFILIRLLVVAINARDAFGSFLIVGICAMIGTQSIENIGMSIGLFPVTGLTLPFVSAGGSSLIANMIAIGIAMSVSARRKKSLFLS